MLRVPALAGTAAVLATLVFASSASASVWFTDVIEGQVSRANSTGQIVDSNAIVADQDRNLTGLAVDGRFVYWSNAAEDSDADASSIGRAELDVTGDVIPASVDQDFITGLKQPTGIAVDVRADRTYLYWADPLTEHPFGVDPPEGLDRIGRIQLTPDGEIVDGSLNQDFITGATGPADVEVSGNDIYWTNEGLDAIGHARMNAAGAIVGTPNHQVIPEGDEAPNDPASLPDVLDPYGIAVDDGILYWTNQSYKYANPLFDPEQAEGPFNRRVIYGDGKTISRAALGANGVPSSAVQREFVGSQERPNSDVATGAQSPGALATDGTYIYWANTGVPFFSNMDDDLGRTPIDNPDGGFQYSFAPTGLSNAIVAQRDSSVSVSCPASVQSRVACTVTVADADPDTGEPPAGRVKLDASGAGDFDPVASECLLAPVGETTTSSCTIDYVREGDAGQLIEADYAGSPLHANAHGSGPLLPRLVNRPPDPPFIEPPLPKTFDLKKALKKCKKKKGKAKKKCIKKAKAKAKG